MKKRPAVPPSQLVLFDDWLVAPQPTDTEQPGRFSSTTSPPPIDSPPSPMAPEPGPLSMDESRHLLAQRLATKLNADGEITSSFLFETANHAFGGTQAAGTYSSKDAYDAMEAAFNLHLLAIERNDWSEQQGPEWAARKVMELTARMQRLPTQPRRDPEMDEFQQFSSPPPLAFVANWVARVTSADRMMEPSAGTGALAVWSRIADADLRSEERRVGKECRSRWSPYH